MLASEKTDVFWLGLIVLGFASIVLFAVLYYPTVFYSRFFDWRSLVPAIVGSVVFILIGLYMMRSGTKKSEQTRIQPLSQ